MSNWRNKFNASMDKTTTRWAKAQLIKAIKKIIKNKEI